MINDTYGHIAGDHVLRELAQLLKNNIRKYDFVARYGGEEFMILFPNTSTNKAAKLSERIRKSVEEHSFHAGKKSFGITVSIGIGSLTPGELDIDLYDFVKNVDKLMYKAKTSGKNQIRYDRVEGL